MMPATVTVVIVARPGWRLIDSSHGPSAEAICPHCGAAIALSGYRILPSGEVHPKTVCPQDDCRFVGFLHLADWAGGLCP